MDDDGEDGGNEKEEEDGSDDVIEFWDPLWDEGKDENIEFDVDFLEFFVLNIEVTNLKSFCFFGCLLNCFQNISVDGLDGSEVASNDLLDDTVDFKDIIE